MGCHTWVFKRDRKFTSAEQKTVIEATLNSLSKPMPYEEWLETDFGKMAKESQFDERKIYEDSKAHCLTVETILRSAKKFADIPNDMLDLLRLDSIGMETSGFRASYFIIGDWHYTHTDFDYPFRVYGYPEDTFTDVEELLSWLKKYSEENGDSVIGYYKDEAEDGTYYYEFVEGYTEELEKRIRKYFNKNGKKSLYIEFG